MSNTDWKEKYALLVRWLEEMDEWHAARGMATHPPKGVEAKTLLLEIIAEAIAEAKNETTPPTN